MDCDCMDPEEAPMLVLPDVFEKLLRVTRPSFRSDAVLCTSRVLINSITVREIYLLLNDFGDSPKAKLRFVQPFLSILPIYSSQYIFSFNHSSNI